MNKIKIALLKFVLVLVKTLYVYKIWHKIYTFIYERQYKDVAVPLAKTYKDIHNQTRWLTYRSDGFKQLWDAVSSPQRLQHLINNKLIESGVDCGAWAMYNAHVINQSVKFQVFESISSASFMTLMWLDDKGKAQAHNVTLIGTLNKAGCTYSYMDYWYPSEQRNSIKEVFWDILKDYSPEDFTFVGAIVYKEDLTPIEYIGEL